MYKYEILYGHHDQPSGIYESTIGAVRADSFEAALKRVLDYYNNYIITTIKLTAIDDIVDFMDIREI